MITGRFDGSMDQSIYIAVDHSSVHYKDYERYLFPLLKNFGFCLHVVAEDEFERLASDDLACIVFAHRGISISQDLIDRIIIHCSECGAGIVSFDNDLELCSRSDENNISSDSCSTDENLKDKVIIEDVSHYITASHSKKASFTLTKKCAESVRECLNEERFFYNTLLVSTDSRPLVAIQYNNGVKVLRFSVPYIFSSSSEGLLFCIDDIIKRGVIWTARKPLVSKLVKKFANFRVDDCCGDHGYYKDNPFGWISIANKYGFKPWVGFFWEEMSDASLKKLSRYVKESKATAQFHGMYLMGKTFFNAEVREIGISSFIKNWLSEKNVDLPLSCYMVPHSYDLTSSCIADFKEMGVEAIGTPYLPDTSGAASKNTANWLCGGPYRLYDEGKDNNPWDFHQQGTSFYYADWLTDKNGEKLIFNTLTELRDVNGYEWFSFSNAPEQYEDVRAAVKKGTEIFKRCFDSDILPVLFTHEDAWREMFLAKILPDILDRVFAGIALNISRYSPSFETLDDSVRYIRSLNETSISSLCYDKESSKMFVEMSGKAETAVSLAVYNENEGTIFQTTADVAVFSGETELEFSVKNNVILGKSTIFNKETPVEYITFDAPKNIGTAFTVVKEGNITGIKCYFMKSDSGVHSVSLWDAVAGRYIFIDDKWNVEVDEDGWYSYSLSLPVHAECGQQFIAYVSTLKGSSDLYGTVFAYCGHMYPYNNTCVRCEGMAGVVADFDYGTVPVSSEDAFFRDIEFIPDLTEVKK